VTLEDLDMYAPLSTIDTYDYGYVFNNEELDEAYKDLKFAHKQIVYMTYVMDKSDREISKKLNMPLNTCYTRRKAALDNLREIIHA
jgi:DNA-directed RNA polymerase specialized sigma24 family protein